MAENYNRPEWDEYFLNIAQEVGKRSTCLRRRYGAIIVKDKIIISTGQKIRSDHTGYALRLTC